MLGVSKMTVYRWVSGFGYRLLPVAAIFGIVRSKCVTLPTSALDNQTLVWYLWVNSRDIHRTEGLLVREGAA